MRKLTIITLVLSILLLISCERKLIKLNDPDISINESLKSFYELDSTNFEGENFELKVLDIFKVKTLLMQKSEIDYYQIRIIIAPKYEKRIDLKSIKVEPVDNKMSNYLNGQSPIGAGNIDLWNSITDKLDFFNWEKIEDTNSFILSLTFNNLTDSYMKEENILENEIENAIKNLKVTITYNNNKKDVILIVDAMIEETSEDVLKTRNDLYELYTTGQTINSLEVYK